MLYNLQLNLVAIHGYLDKDLESTFKEPITQFIDHSKCSKLLIQEQKIQNIIANKIIREVETESMFAYGVGGFITWKLQQVSVI